MPPELAQRFVAELAESGIELGADQAAAVRGVLTSGARIESLVGPAGTGKSFVVGALAKAWQDPGLWGGAERRVFGLAASQIATGVLTDEGLRASNITRWLGAQERRRRGVAAAARATSWWSTSPRWRPPPTSPRCTATPRRPGRSCCSSATTGSSPRSARVAAWSCSPTPARATSWPRPAGSSTSGSARASLRLRAADETVLGEYHKHGRLLDAGAADQAEASAARAWLADTLSGKDALLVVDTNEQAARLSASLRAELVRLGRVAEDGVPLDLQGTYAGVGDIVQARLNGWNLAGFDGNRRGPINRETYRVLATRADGGLVVAPIGDESGERLTLPGSYVAEHVALGYASTAHAGQGRTVDTAHTVVTGTTGADALYVGMSRGRYANTAHVTTVAVPEDRAQGSSADALHRSPSAVLAGVLESAETTKSALATATESAEENASVRTPAELLDDAIELATAGRTARWLDRLVDDELLTPQERARIAAEDGAATLSRLLRRVELAGHDPEAVLRGAVAGRDFDDARQLTNVLHHRITEGRRLDPIGDSYAERLPRVDEPAYQRYLDTLAEAADARREELGAELAEEPPQWAVEALGEPPTAPQERAAWERRAGTVAAHRELTGHDDDAAALGAGAEGRPDRGVRVVACGLAGVGPAGGRPRRAGDVRGAAADAGPRLRAGEGVGAAVRRERAGRDAAGGRGPPPDRGAAHGGGRDGDRGGAGAARTRGSRGVGTCRGARRAGGAAGGRGRHPHAVASAHRRDPGRGRPRVGRVDRSARGRRGPGAGGHRRGVARAARRGDARRGRAPGGHRPRRRARRRGAGDGFGRGHPRRRCS